MTQTESSKPSLQVNRIAILFSRKVVRPAFRNTSRHGGGAGTQGGGAGGARARLRGAGAGAGAAAARLRGAAGRGERCGSGDGAAAAHGADAGGDARVARGLRVAAAGGRCAADRFENWAGAALTWRRCSGLRARSDARADGRERRADAAWSCERTSDGGRAAGVLRGAAGLRGLPACVDARGVQQTQVHEHPPSYCYRYDSVSPTSILIANAGKT